MTAPQTALTVRYNPILAYAFLALGALNFVLSLWLLALGAPTFSLVLGALFVVLGVLYLVRPHFVYEPGRSMIEVVAPLGTRRPYSPERGGAFVVDGARIYRTGPSGGRSRVPVSRYMSRRSDWDAVVEVIGVNQPRGGSESDNLIS
ncbi:MAG: hypothetical protein ACRDQ0_07175 [Pseudonocardia sp.]